jgi:PHS family inorganic phosphate transporter-like MFS transporter
MVMAGNHFELERVVKNDSSGDELDNKDSETSKKVKALSQIDNAKFGWFHVRAVLVSGVGFFTVK